MKQISLILLLLFSTIAFAQVSDSNLMATAKEAFNSANYPAALAHYNKVIAADQSNMEALFWRGRTKVQLKDMPGAKSDFEQVLKREPGNFGCLVNLANLCSLLEDYTTALAYCKRAELLDSTSAAVYENKGRIYYNMKQFELARVAFTRAIAIDPSDVALYHLRSDCYNFTGKMKLAKADLEQILFIDSTDSHARINLAFCFIMEKDFLRANNLYEKLYQLNNDDPIVLSNFGYVKHMLKNTKDGLNLIQRSLELFPGNAYAYKYLAEIYLSERDNKRACKAIETGIKLGFTASYGQELEQLKKANCR